jgi:uncharacterized protein YegP (UPF0339 family)
MEVRMAVTFELYQDATRQWRWRLRHQNGRIIAESGEGYVAKADALNGIEVVKKDGPAAQVSG